MKLINRYSLVLLAFALILSSCVTRKKKEDVSFLRKTYQNITSKYNGYFNANVIYQEALIKLNNQHVDNYARVLDMYPYMAVENPKAVGPDMDKVVEKVSTVATLRPASDWVDDCYLMAGKAQYLKQDFESAEETLEYMAKNFSPEGLKERLKGINKQKMLDKERKEREKQKELEQRQKEEQREKAKEEKEAAKKQLLKDKAKEKKAKEKAKKQAQKAKEKQKKQAAKDKKKGKSSKSAKPQTKTQSTDENVQTTPETKQETKQTEVKSESKPEQSITDKKKEEEKKKTEKPEKFFLKRKPAYQEGLVWLARTYIEEQKFDEALSVMNKLLSNPKTFPHVMAQLNELRAYYFLKQKKYDLAIEPLQAAVASSKVKKDKARFTYIIAQIHQNNKRMNEALAAYRQVLKFQPSYEMEFNAHLNIALNGLRSGTTPLADAKKYLQKMIKDVKNAEFKDQIYFTLAKLDIESKDYPLAIENLKASLAANSKNKAQKTESYLLLAELYYNNANYVNSKAYYDSTLMVMNNADERYNQTKRFSNSLTEIAKNQQVVILQDSLIKIAGMSSDDQIKLAKELKKREEEAKKSAQQAVVSSQKNTGSSDPLSQIENRPGFNRGISLSGGNKSTFFAYDEKQVKKGQKEFQKLWGQRELTDDWRRVRSTSNTPQNNQAVTALSSEEEEKMIREMLAAVPKNPKEIEEAENKIKVAMLNLGRLYQDQLKDDSKSIAQLEELLSRFPDSQHELEAWYLLYLAYNNKGDLANAQVYYNKIIGKYPATTYARVLSDPKYLDETNAQKNRLDRYYDDTYNLFAAARYQEAQEKIKQASREFGTDNKYKIKFAMLNAMISGNIEGKTAYIGALKEIIAKYPNTEEEKRAKEIIRILGVESAAPLAKDTTSNVMTYTYTPNDVHYVMVILGAALEKINDIKIEITNYNREYYSFDKLKVTNIFLDTQTPLVVIRQFDKAELAFKYVENAALNMRGFYKDFKPEQLVVISKENYKAFLLNKNLEDYKKYLEQNYRR